MSTKIYVGNLPYTVLDAELHDQFSRYGQVGSAKVMMDRDTGRSKGFGFVEMGDDEQARQAIAGLDGVQVAGRALKVNEARPRV